MNRVRAAAALLTFFILTVPARAQDAGLAFLRIGTNAAAMGLGDAYVAHSRDAFSTYWNPAGLAAAESNTAALSHHIWIADVRTYALAARLQAGEKGAIGIFATGTGAGDLEARERPGDPDGFFSVQYVSTGLSYGRSFGPLRAGATVKYLAERIYTDDANGYAFDLGLQMDLARRAIQLGVALQNIGEMSGLDITETPLPRTMRAGVAVFPLRVLTEGDRSSLLNTFITAEVSHVFEDEIDQATRIHVGIAAEVLELVMLRAGYISNDEVRRFTTGGGLEYGSFIVDYAFLPFQDGFGGPGHVLTLLYKW